VPHDLDNGWLGRRVVLRRRVGSGRFADVLGEVVDTGDPVRIRRENGEIVAIGHADIHRLKPIAARPVRPTSTTRLEEIAAAGWPAPDTAWLGRWLLRAADGWTGRANSVLPLGDPDVTDPISAVRQWYARRQLPAQFQVALPDPLDDVLGDAGFAAGPTTLMQTASLAAVSGPPLPGLPAVALDSTPSPAWLGSWRGGQTLPPVAVSVLTGAALPIFATVSEGDRVAAIARAVVDSGWLGVTALEVMPEFRRRGVATHVLRSLATWGAQNGARQAYLQVFESNSGAVAVYERLGFSTHHTYHYRTDTAPAP
jgi:GNAT superfamily N-acetyltransferase